MSKQARYQVLVYRGSGNLGDAIQTYALCRLLSRAIGVYRDNLSGLALGPTAVVNGYLNARPPVDGPNCLFAGVYVPWGWHYYRWIEWIRQTRFRMAGARDPVTLARLEGQNATAEMVGCATLTLERYHGPRRGVYAVDLREKSQGPECVSLTHKIPRGMSWPDQWRRATDFLAAYRTAERVYTSRLHVALPCLAFGTPVYLRKKWEWFGMTSTRGRFSLYDSIGLPYGEFVEFDVALHKQRFLRFMEVSLAHKITEHDPIPPAVGADEG